MKNHSPQRPNAAEPQPKLGISPAKHVLSEVEGTPNSQSSENNGENHSREYLSFTPNLAPLRLGRRNIRVGESLTCRKIAQTAKNLNGSIEVFLVEFGGLCAAAVRSHLIG